MGTAAAAAKGCAIRELANARRKAMPISPKAALYETTTGRDERRRSELGIVLVLFCLVLVPVIASVMVAPTPVDSLFAQFP
jgi:hypothetical protein